MDWTCDHMLQSCCNLSNASFNSSYISVLWNNFECEKPFIGLEREGNLALRSEVQKFSMWNTLQKSLIFSDPGGLSFCISGMRNSKVMHYLVQWQTEDFQEGAPGAREGSAVT